nr:4Fe-4S dicluster domain-containing protein [Azospirillum rugosum]
MPPPAFPRLADSQPWPWVPSIDASVCEGCAGCARLCPTGAIRLDPESAAFRIAAEDCTGCRLCVDVCRPDALILERLAPRRQTAVPLHARRCPSCGVTARLPAPRPGADALCPVCRRTTNRRRLFQVLDDADESPGPSATP